MRLADRTVLEAHGSSRRAMAARHADGSWLQRVIAALLLSKECGSYTLPPFCAEEASWDPASFRSGSPFLDGSPLGQRTHAVGAALGVVLGMATALPAYRWLAVLVTLLGGLFLLETEPSPARARRPLRYLWRQALFLALGHLAARLLFANLFEEPLGSPVWLVIEASLVTTSTVIWGPLALLWGSEGRSHFSREEWVGIALFCVMLSLGLAGLQSGPIVPSELWNRLVTLVGASIGGATAGAAVGTAMGWIMGMHGSVPFGGTGVYALAGLLAGLFSLRQTDGRRRLPPRSPAPFRPDCQPGRDRLQPPACPACRRAPRRRARRLAACLGTGAAGKPGAGAVRPGQGRAAAPGCLRPAGENGKPSGRNGAHLRRRRGGPGRGGGARRRHGIGRARPDRALVLPVPRLPQVLGRAFVPNV